MIKRLFQVRSAAGDPLRWGPEHGGDVRYFNSKVEAKLARDEAITTQGVPHHVALGPDHRFYEAAQWLSEH